MADDSPLARTLRLLRLLQRDRLGLLLPPPLEGPGQISLHFGVSRSELEELLKALDHLIEGQGCLSSPVPGEFAIRRRLTGPDEVVISLFSSPIFRQDKACNRNSSPLEASSSSTSGEGWPHSVHSCREAGFICSQAGHRQIVKSCFPASVPRDHILGDLLFSIPAISTPKSSATARGMDSIGTAGKGRAPPHARTLHDNSPQTS